MTRPSPRAAIVLLALACCLGLAVPLGSSALARDRAQPAKAKVEIVEFSYKPGRITVAKGARLTFVNESKYTHTASNGHGDFDTGHIPPGGSATVRFAQRGVYSYRCELHPFMTGKVVVK